MFKDYICFQGQNTFFQKLGVEGIPVTVLKSENKSVLLKAIQEQRRLKKIVIAEGGSLNRLMIEQKLIDILVNPEKGIERDFLHSRNSGLNQVLCRLAKQNKSVIGFSFSAFLNCEGEVRAMLLGRMMQNVRLCRKYKVKIILGSFAKNEFELRNRDALLHFGIFLGMKPEEAKRALEKN